MDDETDFEILFLEKVRSVKYEIPVTSKAKGKASKRRKAASSHVVIAYTEDTLSNITNASVEISPVFARSAVLQPLKSTDELSVASNKSKSIDTDLYSSDDFDSGNYTDSNTIVSSLIYSSDTENTLEGTEAVGGPDGQKASARYSIPKVQVKPGRTIDTNPDGLAANYLTRLPVLKEQAAAYIPMPYIFRVNAACNRIKIQNMWARCPPFHLLLDHAIAVIWLLFSKTEYDCPLGIAQLQWALAFLKTVHTRQGDQPKDVQTCIGTIENILLDRYAELSTDIAGVSKLDETVHYIDGALGSQSMVVKSIPFSLNYAEMMDRCPAATAAADESRLSMTSAEAKQELDNLKAAAGVRSIESLDTVSKHKAIDVLKAWKSEQVDKIRGELKRLRSIEDKMKDIDDNFEGYEEGICDMLYD